MAKGKRRQAPEINASSMADIAFLLLIFFLVTTEIVEDQGILVKLPPIPEDIEEVKIQIAPRNLFFVLVNKDNDLLVRGEQLEVAQLREKAKEFIMNPAGNPELAAAPNKAIISLKNDRGTSYETYVTVYNELQAAYNELWNEESQRMYGKPYSDDMPAAQIKAIKDKIPFVLSEAEPTEFGEEN